MIPWHQDFLGKEAETKQTKDEVLTLSLKRSMKQQPQFPVLQVQSPAPHRGSLSCSAPCTGPAAAVQQDWWACSPWHGRSWTHSHKRCDAKFSEFAGKQKIPREYSAIKSPTKRAGNRLCWAAIASRRSAF